jgi:cell division protease FtsH
MVADAWLPIGFVLPDGSRLSTVLDSGPEWQIIEADERKRALVVLYSLLDRWVTSNVLDVRSAQRFQFGARSLAAITSDATHMLACLRNCRSPHGKAEAMAFAIAMKNTRAVDSLSPLHDSLYLEKLSRLLPTYRSGPGVPDDAVLGSWLSGGLNISVFPMRRIQKVLSWLDTDSLREVIEAAGLKVDELVTSSEIKRTHISPNRVSPDNGEPSVEIRFSLPGRKVLETFFNDQVIDIVQNSGRYKSLGIGSPPAIILEGPPGCGKTFAVERLVEFLGWPMYSIDASSIGSPYIHETSRKVAQVFEEAIEHAPSVVVIDEMEAFLADRDSGSGSSHHRVEEVAEFLRRIPEAVKKGVLIIGMTNRIDMIDQAILRRGRFDLITKVDYAGEEEVAALLSSLLHDLPKADGVDITFLAQRLAGRPLSDVTYVVREGARLAARARKSRIDHESLVAALASTPARDPATSAQRIGFT